MQVYHWMFLAQPEPLPETLISGAGQAYVDHTLASWTATNSLDCFKDVLASYRAAFADPQRIHAMCEDYRAGATLDPAADGADFAMGKKIEAPVLALWGDPAFPPRDPRRWRSGRPGRRTCADIPSRAATSCPKNRRSRRSRRS